MIEAYSGWNDALLGMFRRVEHCFKWGIHDRDPLPTWTRGWVTLLGDAAHPMMPTLAQGAAISIEDGYALARNLARHETDVGAGLAAYDTERVPRAGCNCRRGSSSRTDRGWIFALDATRDPEAATQSTEPAR